MKGLSFVTFLRGFVVFAVDTFHTSQNIVPIVAWKLSFWAFCGDLPQSFFASFWFWLAIAT